MSRKAFSSECEKAYLFHKMALPPGSFPVFDKAIINGPGTIERKTRRAAELGLGGVMIWEVGQDCRVHPVTHGDTTHGVTCPDGESSALLTALRKGLPAGSQENDDLANRIKVEL